MITDVELDSASLRKSPQFTTKTYPIIRELLETFSKDVANLLQCGNLKTTVGCGGEESWANLTCTITKETGFWKFAKSQLCFNFTAYFDANKDDGSKFFRFDIGVDKQFKQNQNLTGRIAKLWEDLAPFRGSAKFEIKYSF